MHDAPLAPPLSWLSQGLDPATRHLAADLFVDLEPGCYEVLAVPAAEIVGEAWSASTDCSRAGSGRLRVSRGRTALTALLPQCMGDRHGRRDVLAGLNRPPALSLQSAEVSVRAGESVRTCATVTDPDDDPITVSFAIPSEGASPSEVDALSLTVGEPTLLGFEGGRRRWQVCADIVGAAAASYEVRAEAHDLGWSLGRVVRLEELVAPAESHASATLPVHVRCADATCS